MTDHGWSHTQSQEAEVVDTGETAVSKVNDDILWRFSGIESRLDCGMTYRYSNYKGPITRTGPMWIEL